MLPWEDWIKSVQQNHIFNLKKSPKQRLNSVLETLDIPQVCCRAVAWAITGSDYGGTPPHLI